jgi:acyl-CoA reductase-like NAD-dependent aldehyde dehydrogenase
VVTGLPNSAAAGQQKVFDLASCVLPFDSGEDLLKQANDSVCGLAERLLTVDHQRAWRVANRLKARAAWVSTYKQLSISALFGGFKDSGIVREKGVAG